MKLLPKDVFDRFEKNIIVPLYHPSHPVETLQARLTATSLLHHRDFCTVKLAESLLLRTSVLAKADLSRLHQFSSQVRKWDELHICSSYANFKGLFLEYKLGFTTLSGRAQMAHFHAHFEIKDGKCYFVSQTFPLIRIIGDPVLHRPGLLFPNSPSLTDHQELAQQIDHAKSVLIQTGGAGIAANQCAGIEHPYRFTVVGVFHEIPEHVANVERRYPNTQFPQAKVMVNPVIMAMSCAIQQFDHACLSVPSSNRCAVTSPQEINVQYLDALQNLKIKQAKCTGIDAVVLWHELAHILDGKTYMDATFESLPSEDLAHFQNRLQHEIKRRKEETFHLPELTVPPFHFSVKINERGAPRLDPEELTHALPKMTEETLLGLLQRAALIKS